MYYKIHCSLIFQYARFRRGTPPIVSAPEPQPSMQISSPHTTPQTGYFKIRSKLNRMVLDVAGSRMKKGEKVITYPEKSKNGDNQVNRIRLNTTKFKLKIGTRIKYHNNMTVSEKQINRYILKNS